MLPLTPQPVAEFYGRVTDMLRALGIETAINEIPNELPDPIPFSRDHTHCSYDWQPLTRSGGP